MQTTQTKPAPRSLLDPTGNEAAERIAVAQTERAGSWYGDRDADGRMLTQDETVLWHRQLCRMREQLNSMLGVGRSDVPANHLMLERLIAEFRAGSGLALEGNGPLPAGTFGDDMIDAMLHAHSHNVTRSTLGTRVAELDRRRSTEDYRARAESTESREARRLVLETEAPVLNNAKRERRPAPPVPKWAKPKRQRQSKPGR